MSWHNNKTIARCCKELFIVVWFWVSSEKLLQNITKCCRDRELLHLIIYVSMLRTLKLHIYLFLMSILSEPIIMIIVSAVLLGRMSRSKSLK